MEGEVLPRPEALHRKHPLFDKYTKNLLEYAHCLIDEFPNVLTGT